MLLRSLLVALIPVAVAETAFDQPFSASYARLLHKPCTTLFYRNGRVGCGTDDHSFQVGELVYFEGNLPSTDKSYVVVMEEHFLTAQSMDTLMGARGGLLKGILVLNSTSVEDGDQSHSYYSPEAKSPQGYGTPSANLNYGYNAYAWNAKGQGLFDYNLHGMPMAFVYDSDVSESLRIESQSSGGDAPVVAEFNYYMGPENMNSYQCLAWKNDATDEWSPKCLPLGGNSVWASAGSPPTQKSSSSSSSNNKNNNNNNGSSSSNNKKPVILVAASMDSASMFHDATPGANTAASNILTVLMAAKLIGSYLDDDTLDALPKRIVFALFQGESYGFIGSRRFLRDLAYPGFQCSTSPVYAVPRLGDKSDLACLDPLRPNLKFAGLSQIAGMISVDQIGHLVGDGLMYVHSDVNNDSYGKFLSNVLKYSGTTDFNVASATSTNNGNGYAFPPSPLTSLLQLSQGAVGGVVLTGYDYAFTNKQPYHSHRDSVDYMSINMNSIAAAATIIARGALAAAYDNGNYDYSSASYYAKNKIAELSYSDQSLNKLAYCLLYDGTCDLLKKYSSVETSNERVKTGLSLASGEAMQKPPNYYVSVYHQNYGQPFAVVGDKVFGAYNGHDFGNKDSDAIGMTPNMLESAIHGLFNDYLGRGSGMEGQAQSCNSVSDCANVDYCAAYGDRATCTGGGQCVCQRANYHVALDEALLPAENMAPGYFVVSSDDNQISPMYTEPYWSSVGIRVYRDAGWLPGFLTLASGFAVGGISLFSAFVLKVGLKKEKLY